MSISCEIFTYQNEAIEGVSVILQCVDRPGYRFDGRTDEDGMIQKWTALSGQILLIPRASDVCNLQWEMVFNVSDHLGPAAFFQQIRHRIWLPACENFHVKLQIGHEMYAMTKNDLSQVYAAESPGFLKVSPLGPAPGVWIGPPLELERLSGYSEPYSPSMEEPN